MFRTASAWLRRVTDSTVSLQAAPTALPSLKLTHGLKAKLPSMKTTRILLRQRMLRFLMVLTALCLAAPAGRAFPIITNVVETGGDNEATDTVPAKWTGVTYVGGVANEPRPGLAAGAPYTVGFFGVTEPCYVDRAHCYTNAAVGLAVPSYLLGGEYIMSGNDNRDNAGYLLDVYVATPVHVFMLIDNRLGGNAADPPTFDATHMQWILDQGWVAVKTGANRTANASLPDEVGVDEGADGTINNWFSVYTKDFPAGTFQLRQADNTGQNMYGVVITGASPPAAPANLVAVGGDAKVTLSWSAAAGAAGYIVKRSLIAGGPYDNIATNAAAATGYMDSPLINGVTYYYVVSAFNPAGESANSNEATGEPKAAPTGLLAIGGTNQVEVRWDPFPGAASYTVKRASTSGGPYSTLATGVTDTNYLDTGLLNGRFYYYVVIAQLLLGGDSGQSSEAAGLTAPGAPTSAASLLAATVIKLTWATTDPVLSSFAIEESLDGINFAPRATVPGSARAYLATGLSAATTYSYRIQAANATGPSGYSTPVSASTPTYGLNANFANASFATNFPGYFNDYGAIFGLQPNGMNYGWDVDNTANARERNSVNSPDKRYDTFNHLQKPLPAGRSWEIEIPNGFYQVHFAAGDPDNVDSVFQHNIEGVLTETRFPGGGTNFFEFTKTVIIDDGRLTIGNGPFATNSKICYVDIYAATATTAPVIATQPQPVTVEDRHAATFSVTLSGGTEPFRYQWLHDDMAIPGATGPTLKLPDVMMADAGAYKVAVSNYAGAVTSDAAMLTVLADTNPPVVVAVTSLDGATITVCFSEFMDQSQAEDSLNYRIVSPEGNAVIGAVLQPDGRTVVLTLFSPIPDSFSIEVSTAPDRAGNSVAVVVVSGRVLGFAGEDINAPTLAGSHYTCDGSTFVITGGGTPFTGAADQLHFVYCAVQGDFEVRVRVTDLAISNVYARAMLMVRESTAAGSRHATLSVNAPAPGRDLGEPLARSTTGGAIASWGANFSPAGIPVWLRITRAGSTLTGYRSANGMNWTQVSQATIALPVGLLVGMGVNAHDSTTRATGTFTDFRIDWLTPAPVIMNPIYNAGTFSGSFSSVAGLTYKVQFKDDVASPSWSLLTTVGGNGSAVPFTDPGPISSSGLRVYRINLR
jgi:hypothetical protein